MAKKDLDGSIFLIYNLVISQLFFVIKWTISPEEHSETSGGSIVGVPTHSNFSYRLKYFAR